MGSKYILYISCDVIMYYGKNRLTLCAVTIFFFAYNYHRVDHNRHDQDRQVHFACTNNISFVWSSNLGQKPFARDSHTTSQNY